MYTVYALVDPRDYTTRYIGITSDVYARFFQHLSCHDPNKDKNAWIKELKQSQAMLIMKTLEVVETEAQAIEREKHWIHHYRFMGALLLNKLIPSIAVASPVVVTPVSKVETTYPKTKKIEPAKTYTLAQTARRLNKSTRTIHRYIKAGAFTRGLIVQEHEERNDYIFTEDAFSLFDDKGKLLTKLPLREKKKDIQPREKRPYNRRVVKYKHGKMRSKSVHS